MKAYHAQILLGLLALPISLLAQDTLDHEEDDLVVLPKREVIATIAQADELTETFDLTSERKVDLLFVIDDSKTMKEEQKILAQSFQEFIEKFTLKNLNLHIGIIRMSLNDGKLIAGKNWSLPFLTSETPGLIQEFAKTALLGHKGSNAETAILPILACLKNPANKDFFRSDAFLSIVIISDEDESFGGRNTKYIRDNPLVYAQRLTDLKTSLIAFKLGKKGMYRIDAVTAPNPVPPGCPTKVSGIALMEVARQNGGRAISICDNFAPALIQIADDVANVAQRRFSLKKWPIVDSIRVTINGAQVPKEAENGYTLDFEANAINLHGLSLQRSFGSVVTISYKWLEEEPEPPETEETEGAEKK